MQYRLFIVFLFIASASAYTPHEPPTCQFPATLLVYIDQTIDDPNAILEPDPELKFFKVAVQACDHETTTHTKAYLFQTRSTDGNKLYIK